VCSRFEALGISIDDTLNRQPSRQARVIDDGTQPVRILVVPTNEELEIATQTIECIQNRGG
jgi:acetate kinase